jgi:DNA-binding MurR/RpiR family transcriptional regulator
VVARLTITDLAKAVGVHKSTVSRQTRRLGLVGADGLVDLEEYRAARADLDPALQTTGGTGPARVAPPRSSGGLAVERERKMAADAAMAELALARERGRLVDRAAVEAAVEDLARRMRDRVLAVPREVAGDCARLGEEGAIQGRLTLALRQALEALHLELTTDGDAGTA